MTLATVEHKLTTAEAQKLIKLAPSGSIFCVHIRTDIAVNSDDDMVYPNAGGTYANLSRKDMLRIVGDLLSPILENKGGRIVIKVMKRKSYTNKDGIENVYWL